MYSNKHLITHNKIFIFLIFLSILFLNTEIIHAQNSDSLIQIINHSQSAEKINNAKGKLPEHLAKVDMNILDVVRLLKAEGTNRTNAAKKIYKNVFQITAYRLMMMEIFLQMFI